MDEACGLPDHARSPENRRRFVFVAAENGNALSLDVS